MPYALGTTGKRRLAEREAVIENGLAGFLAIGKALTDIRDERLYRDDFDNFEAYLSGRWGMSRSRAYQLMEALELSTIVDNAGALPLANEGQLRALAPVKDDVDAVREIIEQAQAEGDISARNLSKYVKHFKNTQTEGETGAEGSPAEGDASPSSGDGADSHDVGRAEPESVSPLSPEEEGARKFVDAVAREHPEWSIRDEFAKERKHADTLVEFSIFDVVTAVATDDFETRDLREFCDRLAGWAGAVVKLLDQPLRRVK